MGVREIHTEPVRKNPIREDRKRVSRACYFVKFKENGSWSSEREVRRREQEEEEGGGGEEEKERVREREERVVNSVKRQVYFTF